MPFKDADTDAFLRYVSLQKLANVHNSPANIVAGLTHELPTQSILSGIKSRVKGGNAQNSPLSNADGCIALLFRMIQRT